MSKDKGYIDVMIRKAYGTSAKTGKGLRKLEREMALRDFLAFGYGHINIYYVTAALLLTCGAYSLMSDKAEEKSPPMPENHSPLPEQKADDRTASMDMESSARISETDISDPEESTLLAAKEITEEKETVIKEPEADLSAITQEQDSVHHKPATARNIRVVRKVIYKTDTLERP